MKKTTALLGLLALCAVLLSACGDAAPTEPGHDTTKIDQIIEEALVAYNNDDFEGFTKDYSSVMMQGMTVDLFDELVGSVSEASGNYVEGSAIYQGFEMSQGAYVYVYDCEFEKEVVSITAAFMPDLYEIEGFYFVSENIAAAQKALLEAENE